jgi:predicted homoserine dehydrogenase-like protein
MVDWARAAGFEVVAPARAPSTCPPTTQSTPETVWGHYGFTPEMVAAGDFNAQMFNSFLDGTKSAIEMAAVANATGLTPPATASPSRPAASTTCRACCGRRPAAASCTTAGQVEVISSVERDGRPVFRDLRWGVYVTFAPAMGESCDYVERCFREYGLVTDPSGRYSAMYKPTT